MGLDAEINKNLNEEIVISFPWGMPGLEDCREFILNILEDGSPFYYLRCSSQPEIRILLLNPFVIFRDYEFDLDEEAVSQLGITDQKQVAVFCTVNTSRGIGAATVNLLAPVVINVNKLQAKQVVLNNRRYSIRTPLPLGRGSGREVR